MSAHLLKHAVLATYLEPSITDGELISALQFHFPPFIQIILATVPLQTSQDAVDVPKRLEMKEDHDPAPRPNPVPPSTSNPSRPFQSQCNDSTEDTNRFVRQAYYSRASNLTRNGPNCQNVHARNRSNFGNGAETYGEPSHLSQPVALHDLNPNGPAFSRNPQ